MIAGDALPIHSNALIIFLRSPEEGKGKTRLAKTMGAPKALVIYHELLSITFNQIQNLDCTVYLYFFPYIDTHFLEKTLFVGRLQKGSDLGLRMQEAFQDVLQSHQHVLLIGTDCPYITRALLEEAFIQLQNHDVILGPATDGGYYLIGLRQMHEGLFAGIDWSTERVLSQTLQAAEGMNLSISLLPEHDDIDHEDDWIRFLNRPGSHQI
jgi:rSAM/selenodomain-associated transferase 1